MKLTVLVDNNTLIDRYLVGEPGVSFFIQEGGQNILFDVGYSDAFLRNGAILGIDFFDIDFLCLSHSHLDHTWGLEPLIKTFTAELFEGRPFKKPTLIAHPAVFDSKTFTGIDEFGINVSRDKLLKYCNDGLAKTPVWITEHLVFLGEIPRENDFECQEGIGKVLRDGELVEDFNIDDSALCYKSEKGLVIITGCSHAGICNMIEYAKKVCNDQRVFDVIGGLHLQNPPQRQLSKTVAYFEALDMEKIHASHCTDLKSKIAFSKVVEVEEVGSGTILRYE